jgi:hypothetical protein
MPDSTEDLLRFLGEAVEHIIHGLVSIWENRNGS